MNDFDEFFFEHYTRVVASLRLAGGDLVDAEDAAQDAFAKAMTRWGSVSVMDRPATWVYVVAVRELRRRARRDRAAGSGIGPFAFGASATPVQLSGIAPFVP